MFRTDNTNAASSLPAIPSAGTEKFFREGDPSTGTEATDVEAWWLNMVQEELRAVVVGAGITPDKANNAQVYAAIQALIAARTLAGNTDVTLTSPASGEALIYNGAEWVNGTPASALGELRKVLLLNGLRDVISEGSAAQLVNSFPDPYADLSMIDTGASSGYALDATSALINNSGTQTIISSGSGQWLSGTAGFNWSEDDISYAASGKSMNLGVTFDGDFELNFTVQSSEAYIGVYDAAEDASFNPNPGSSSMFESFAKSWWIGPPVSAKNGIWYSTTEVVASAPAHGTAMTLSRVGSTFYLHTGATLIHTWSQTFAGAVRFMVSTSTSLSITSISWTIPGATNNLVLVSDTLATLAVPSTGHFIGLVEPVDALTYNTDLTISMSRDDGAAYDVLTLKQLNQTTIDVNGSPTLVDVVFAEGSITGSSGQNGRYKWNSYNNKELNLHGAAPEFS